MALYTLKDFAELVGRKLPHISQDASPARNKIIVDANKMVDDKNPINAAYILKWQAKKGTVATPPVDSQSVGFKETVKANVGRNYKSDESEFSDGPPAAPGANLFQLDIQLKKKEVELKTENIHLARIKKEKLQGIVIPTVLVKEMMLKHNANLMTSFAPFVDNIINEMAKVKSFSLEEVGQLRAKMVAGLNKSINDSVDLTKSNLKNIISEFSAKRTQGERK